MKELSHHTLPELENYSQSLLKELEPIGLRWAIAKSEYEKADDKKKSVLAAIIAAGEGAFNKRETDAQRSQVYKDYLNTLSNARKEFLIAQVDYDVIRLKLEFVRTIMSNRREEIKGFK